jgi:hypothetical protein
MTSKVYGLKAVTDLWTGDQGGKSDRTIPTGLLGGAGKLRHFFCAIPGEPSANGLERSAPNCGKIEWGS